MRGARGWVSRTPRHHPAGRVSFVPSMGHYHLLDDTLTCASIEAPGLASVLPYVFFAATEHFPLKPSVKVSLHLQQLLFESLGLGEEGAPPHP